MIIQNYTGGGKMTQQQLDEIRERCESVTPGKWKSDDYGLMVLSENPYGKGQMRIVDIRGWGHLTGVGIGALGLSDDEAFEIQKANSRFIAHSREDIPALLDEVERLQEREKALIKAIKGDCMYCTAKCGHGKYPCYCINNNA